MGPIKRLTKRFWITCIVLLAAGAALTLLRARTGRLSSGALVSDLLFAQGSAFLVWGLIRTVGNAHMFDSALWGLKQLRAIYRNRVGHGRKTQEDYLAWRAARPHHDDAVPLLAAAGILLALSALAAVLAQQ